MDEKVVVNVFKRLFWLIPILYILALWPSVSHAQSGYTNVTATVTDPSGVPYGNGTYIINFVNPNTGGNLPSLNGSGFQYSYAGALTSTGALSLPLPDNAVIASSSNNPNTQWQFNICYSDRVTCFSVNITITGASQNVSATLKAAAKAINGLTGVNVLFTALLNPSPPTPAAGMGLLYFKSDKQLYYRNDTGAEIGPLGPSTAATAWAAITAGTNTNIGPFTASGNSWDWTGTTSFLLRVGAGLVTTANGDIGYDTTNKNWHVWQNGVDSFLFSAPVSATYINGDCVQLGVVANVITLVDAGAACGTGGGGGGTFQVNGTNLTSSAVVNFQNSNATDGLTISFSNPSAGNVKLGLSGSLTNAGLANPATTVNSQTCTLGSTCTIPFQHNSTNNTSQAGLNLETSTTNSVGLTVTPTNSGTNVIKFEITGGAYTGTASNLSGTPALPNGTTATTQTIGDNSADLATDAFVIANAGSFNNPMTTLGDIIYENSTPAAARLPGATGQVSVAEILTSTPTSGPTAAAPAWNYPGTPIDAQSGATITIGNTNREVQTISSDASAVAVTFNPTLTANFTFALCATGATNTITPNSGTILGGATAVIPKNYCGYFTSDNTNEYGGIFPSLAAFNVTGLLRGGATGFTGSELSGDATTSGSNAVTLATVNSNVGSFTSANITVNAKGLITAASNGSGGGISGLTTGFIPKAASATSLTNSLCDEGITTANTITCTDTAGLTVVYVTTTGSGAGAFVATQGTAQGHATANTITLEAPASVTAYELVEPGAAATGILHLSNTSNVVTETISAINLASSDVTGQLPIGNVGSAGLSGAGPLSVASTGVISISGGAGEILADATPALTYTPTLGVSGTAGTLAMYPSSGNFTTTWGSAATASNTILGFATAPTTSHLVSCTTSSTTCTLTDSGISSTSPTGTGAIVLANTPTLITPVIGAATGTSLLATGIVDGTASITVTTGTTANLGSTYKSGYTFNQEGTAATAVTYTLPATATGMQYCVANSIVSGTGAANTGVLTVYPPASSYVILKGVRNTIGGGGTHGVASSGAAADAACFVAIDSTDWTVYVQSGTWTAN